jgi:HSP20 family protein
MFFNCNAKIAKKFEVIQRSGNNGSQGIAIMQFCHLLLMNLVSIVVVSPGFEKTDFKLNVEQDTLTISAEKKSEEKQENTKQIRKEYNYRSFKRSFTLDEKIDANGIEAKYVNGVLTLNLPKKTEVKTPAQEIAIQ